MSNETSIRIVCDNCGLASFSGSPRQIGGYRTMRSYLNKKGWLSTPTKDFCCLPCAKTYESRSGRKLKSLAAFN